MENLRVLHITCAGGQKAASHFDWLNSRIFCGNLQNKWGAGSAVKKLREPALSHVRQ